MAGDYRFANMPLRPAIFAELAVELLGNGVPVKRDDIMKTVVGYHQTNGGAPASATDVISVCKKALSHLQSRGVGRSVPNAYGMWIIEGDVESEDPNLEELDDDAELAEDPAIAEYVYVYDLPTYAEHAAVVGNDRWPHKIGYTAVSAESRIAGQVGTALPEHPRIVVTVPSDKALALEKALHAILEVRGQRITTGPGTEWFMTNPDEVRALIDYIVSDQVISDI